MPVHRRALLFPALCAAIMLGTLIPAPLPAQDTPESETKVGTRKSETRTVDWETLRRDEEERGRIDPQTGALLEGPPIVAAVPREELAKTRLPVLLPDDGRMVENMRLFARENHYTAALRDESHSVQITGTRIAQGEIHTKEARRRLEAASGDDGFVYQRTEYGAELSFTRYNVSYNISVECREPDADPRCTGREYLTELAQSLVYVGGGPEE